MASSRSSGTVAYFGLAGLAIALLAVSIVQYRQVVTTFRETAARNKAWAMWMGGIWELQRSTSTIRPGSSVDEFQKKLAAARRDLHTLADPSLEATLKGALDAAECETLALASFSDTRPLIDRSAAATAAYLEIPTAVRSARLAEYVANSAGVRRAVRSWQLLVLASGALVLAKTVFGRRLLRRAAEAEAEARALYVRAADAEAAQRALVDGAAEGIFRVTMKGRYLAANPSFARILGYDSSEELLRDRLATPDSIGELMAQSREGRVVGWETCRTRKNGDPVWLLVNARVTTWRDEPVIEGTIVDITTQRQAEEARRVSEARTRAAKEAAESALRVKAEFLSNVSHEMRTPMNGIIGMAELALETELTDLQHEYVSVVHASALALRDVIEDLLDFSAVEAGRVELDSRPFTLRASLESALADHKVGAAGKGLRLSLEIAPGVPDALAGDDLRIRRVLDNVVGNAIKFTETGSVTVRVGLLERGSARGTLLFAVEDTGVGIPADKQQVVFEAFTQADGSSTRRYGGAGLGLALSHKLVTLLGGQIWLESQPGRGTAVFFTARVEIDEAPVHAGADRHTRIPTSEPHRSRSPSLEILVAEDNEVNQELVLQILQQRGHQVTVVGDGLAAVRAAAARHYDVILMDVQMPLLDGIEATRRIRAAAPRPLRMIALTAHAARGEVERILAAGMDGLLSKPFRIDELVRAIEGGADFGTSIDFADALERVGGDRKLFREIAATFCRELPRQTAAIRVAIEEGDPPALESAAHSLKGACAVLGAKPSAALAKALEEIGAAGSCGGAGPVFSLLQRELAAAAALLSRDDGRAGVAI